MWVHAPGNRGLGGGGPGAFAGLARTAVTRRQPADAPESVRPVAPSRTEGQKSSELLAARPGPGAQELMFKVDPPASEAQQAAMLSAGVLPGA